MSPAGGPGARVVAGLGLLLLGGATAGASGFALVERDAAGLGRAFAGQAALIEPASLAVNPAALPETATLSATLSALGNRLTAEDPDGARAEGGEGALIPAASAAWRGLGIGADVPFGLATDYPDDWSGREAALRSEIRSARLILGGGVAVTERLRLGASLFAQHLAADLSSAVVLVPGFEERVQVEGDDVGLGFGLGVHWRLSEDLALGLGYSSPVRHTLRGEAELPAVLGGRAGSEARLVTPETVTLGGDWRLGSRTRLLGGLTWTRWSRLQRLDIALSNGMTLTEHHQWRDTWRVSLGTEHARGPWTLRAGLAWDQAPIRDDAHRYPRLPDADRTWTTVGLGYAWPGWRLDAGYAHLWFPDRDGEHPALAYESGTDILSLGLTRTW
ncbi:OmpP1/FadL family transporter [Thiococcus pfennigii]|uniref:OmpP1/FadL family transporter n=1 Tax=Thiococcus pfennigii TaxID=1057 RepID=UPI001906757A|nr:outer membrane protein transport protein [Thiococcus pfennigii]MBK1732768.1 hypothetical protein [Thiococcus pfennigii]